MVFPFSQIVTWKKTKASAKCIIRQIKEGINKVILIILLPYSCLICNQSWMELELYCLVIQLHECWPQPLLWVIGNTAMHFLIETHILHSSTMSLHCQNHTHETVSSWWTSPRATGTEFFKDWCHEPQHLGFTILTRLKTYSTPMVFF